MLNLSKTILLGCIISLYTFLTSYSQFVPVGDGSYTTTFPGVDVAGRNSYPTGTPQVSGVAATKPVPTNDWWSTLIKNDHANNMFNYPLALASINEGLIVAYIVPSSGPNGSSQPMGDAKPITVGVTGLNSSRATASDFSDWTVTMAWNSGGHDFTATAGIAMPFLYFTKNSTDVAEIKVYEGIVSIQSEMLIIENSQGGSDYAVYAPTGSSWTKNGNVYTSTLNSKNYWSMAYLPPSAVNVASVANEYKKYAYIFPTNTTTSWTYDESTSKLRTEFRVDTDIKEGADTSILLGLLPHQWGYLAPDSPLPNGYTYQSIRGEIKLLEGNHFMVENTFYGILPTLPYLANYSEKYSPAEMNDKISLIENDGLSTWTDSYNEGQMMNRLIQTARIADEVGNITARDKMIATVKERLEDWLKAETGEVAFLFYYNATWSSLIGYPAGHGQDGNINDHHFHWGYFIHAAAFIEQYNPGWANQWGDMVNLLIKDAANTNRNDSDYPFLRSFSPYAGHCWANGFASFPFGNDQESSSESMQFNSSLIHWGTITGNDSIRDLGIYLYTTEETAINEYWFDVNERTLKSGYGYSLVSRIWGNGYDNQTFWTSDIEAVYGIEMYPMHGGSFYLARDTIYVQQLWEEITQNTGILINEANPNLWHDLMWEYLAFIDPQQAIELYESYPDRSLKFGVSDAQTYYWLHTMNALGRLANITSDYPVSAVFIKNNDTTYVAHNYTDSPITITFSDGKQLYVAANDMVTSRDLEVTGNLTSSYPEAYSNGSVDLSLNVSGSGITKVEFIDGKTLIGTQFSEPYQITALDLAVGMHNFYARIFVNEQFNVTNIVPVKVGRQLPYLGSPIQIPGTFEAGHYDKFEGGLGQGICYSDVSAFNEGGFRPEEYVDANLNGAEGATIGWLADGEWLEYTIDVATAGEYSLNFRYACGNANGGGPFYFEIDGNKISPDINVTSTGKWDTWSSKTVNNIKLSIGTHIMRLQVDHGEVNLGRMAFAYDKPLSYSPPVALAGDNIIVVLPSQTATLDGSQSYDPENLPLSYLWQQVYGPSEAIFSDTIVASPEISNLIEGVYLIRLSVNNGSYSDFDELLVIVSPDSLLAPTISIIAPKNNLQTEAGIEWTITASADDLDGTIEKVEFFINAIKIGEALTLPYQISWVAEEGTYVITTVATDNDGLTSTSAAVNISVSPAPPCTGGPANGDYTYEFTVDQNNPGITFIPGRTGVGSPTCLLYYSTGGGYIPVSMSPNTPKQLIANNGQTITFYFTYSVPEGGERNTSDQKHSFVVGNCAGGSLLNFAPVANAGANKTLTLPTNSVNLDGSGSSDPDSDPLSYLWQQISGPQATLSDTSLPILAASNLVEGVYVFSLTVTDDKGLSDTDQVTITVLGSTSLTDIDEENLHLYPNPVNNYVTLRLPSNSGKIYISDLSGKIIKQVEVHAYTQIIDCQDIQPGVYLIVVKNNSKTMVARMIKN